MNKKEKQTVAEAKDIVLQTSYAMDLDDTAKRKALKAIEKLAWRIIDLQEGYR